MRHLGDVDKLTVTVPFVSPPWAAVFS